MRRCLVAVQLVACSSPASTPDAFVGPWTQPAMLEERALEPGVTALGDRLVVLGGFATSLQQGLSISKHVHRLDPFAFAWDELPDVPVAWTHAQLAGKGGALYLLGGLEGQQYTARGDAFVLDAGAAAWRSLAPMPTGLERGSAGIAIAGEHVLLLGGASSTAALATCLDYDIATDTWAQLPDLPAPRSHPAAMRMIDGTLIVAGGLGTLDASEPHGDVFALAPNASAWTTGRAAMRVARGGCAYGVIDAELICAGGEAGQSALHVVESYDPVTDTWRDRDDLPDERAGTQGAAIGRRFFLPGGARVLQFQPLDTLLVYSPQVL